MTEDRGSPPPPSRESTDENQSETSAPGPGSTNNPSDGQEADIFRVPILNSGPRLRKNPSDGQGTKVARLPIFNPGPRPSNLPREAICLTIKLNYVEVVEQHPKLHLSSHEAFLLTRCVETLKDCPGMFSRDLIVYDILSKRYNMNISNRKSGSRRRFLVDTDWHKFCVQHKMKQSDVLMFYRFLDNVSGQDYYRLEFFRIPEPRPASSPRLEPSDDPEDDESCCLSRTLTSREVDPRNPTFRLNYRKARDLTGRTGFLSLPLVVYDESNRTYNMQLSSYYSDKGWAGYHLTEDWGEFVKVHNLKARDRIFFSRHVAEQYTNPSDRVYYELKYMREDPELAEVKVVNDERAPEEQSPGRKSSLSKVLLDETKCLSRTLSSSEVIHDDGKPRLFLDAREAGLLIRCSDITKEYPLGLEASLLENLMVFDADGMRYDMLMSHFKSLDGKVVYSVDGGWQRFVKSHKLKAGDEIFFHRFLDKAFQDEHYYVIRYTRKESLGPA